MIQSGVRLYVMDFGYCITFRCYTSCNIDLAKQKWPHYWDNAALVWNFVLSAIMLKFPQSNVHTGRPVHQIPCRAAMNSVEWNPKYNLLAYAGDDKNKYQTDEGTILFNDR